MEKYAGTQAIARTFQLINLFDDDNPVWSHTSLVEASNLKRTTVFRLMAALEAEGIVRKTEEGDFTLGPTLIMLGGRAIRTNRLRSIAQPFLRELVHETGESVTIDVLWIDEAQRPESMVIEEQLAQRVLGLSQYIGARFPAHTTATGKVLLAFQPSERLEQLELTPLDSFTDDTLKTTDSLHEILIQIRKQAYATTINELEVGLAAIAAPIFNHHGKVQAALCVAGSSSRLPLQTLQNHSETLIDYAEQISQKMGYIK